MKKFRILSLVALFMACLFGSTFAEETQATDRKQFQASQSYELSELILLFSNYKTSTSSVISNDTYNDDPLRYLYNLKKNELERPLIKTNDYFGGQIGLLINGNGYTTQKQSWQDGILQNDFIKMGYTTNALFLCPLYWGFNALELALDISPVYVKKHLGITEVAEYLNFKNYFKEKNISATVISSTGSLFSGKTIWEITTPSNKNVYLIVCQSCGANSVVGSTQFIIFYEKSDALQSYKAIKTFD